MIKTKQRPPTRRGAALVEAALILPLMVMMVLGVVEFGRALMVSQLMAGAAREGTRLAVRDGISNLQVEYSVKEFLESALNVDPATIDVTITVTPFPGNLDPGNQLAFAQQRDLCEVTVRIPFDQVNYSPSKYLAAQQLIGHAAMRHE